MKRRGAVLLFAVVAAVGLYAVPAGAVGSHGSHHERVLVVDKDSHRHKSCYGKHRRIFRTIQSAVVAADPGDTIRVCPGTYQETVKVEEPNLTILGANAGRDATDHGRGQESIVLGTPGTPVLGVVQLLADDITWDGFTINGIAADQNSPGMYTSPTHSGYLIRDTIFFDNGSGIHLGSNGTHPTLVCRNRFTENNEFEGPTGAFGIYSDEGARQVLITSNRFEGHNTAAIFFAGPADAQRDVLIEHNKSVDDMSFATIFNSTRVRVTSNWIRARVNDPPFTDKPASAIFIGAGNNDIVVQKNKVVSASGNGIHITDTNKAGTDGTPPTDVTVRRNKVEHTLEFGLEVSASGAQYQILANRSSSNKVGIHLGPKANAVVVTGNTALDNTGFDCQDQSSPLANTWQENVGATSGPPNTAICTAPADLNRAAYDNDGHGKDHNKQKHKKHRKHHKKQKKHKKHPQDPCVCTLPWRF